MNTPLSLLLLVVISASVRADTAFVQSCSNRASDGQTNLTCTFSAGVGSGNVVACGVFAGDQTALDGISDNGTGNSYSIVDTVLGESAKGDSVYAKNVAGAPTAVTVTWTEATDAFHAIACHEITGADTSDPLDGHSAQEQTNTSTEPDSISSGSFTT